MKSTAEIQFLAFVVTSIFPINCPQSIPIVANPSGSPPAGLDGPNRYPGPPFLGPPPPRPPPQASNPFISILGNLLGGLGSFAANNPPFEPNYPQNMPPTRFPQFGRLNQQPPEAVIACSAPPSPQTVMSPGGQRPSQEVSSDAANKTGFCVPSPLDCRARGGSLLGPCLRYGPPNAPPQIFAACCYFEATCGQVIHVNGTHFRSPNFPDPYPSPGSCQVTIKNTYSNVCQIRLDFFVFNLKQPVLGNCNSDRFVVNGQANNDIIPSICGYNPDQHMYIEVDESSGNQFFSTSPSNLLTLNVITSGTRNRWFDIKVSYISCDSQYRAPRHCLQYFYELIGQVRSFNYDLFNQGFTYFNNLDYTICFRKWSGFCTVSFNVPIEEEPEQSENENDLFPERDEVGGLKKIAMPTTKAVKFRPNDRQRKPQEIRPLHQMTFFHIVSGQANQQFAGAGPLKCVSDYIVLNSVRFCGSHLNDAAIYRNNVDIDTVIVDNSTGPVTARFVTSTDAVSKGFILDYQLNPCLLNG